MKAGKPVTVAATIKANFCLSLDLGSLLSRVHRGDAVAQFDLGLMYELGRGCAQNHREAHKWYRAAAENGLAAAQNDLAYLYEGGLCVKRDDKQVLKWYRAAAEQGWAGAQFNLGNIYSAGKLVPKDYGQACKYYSAAAEQGLQAAQYAVAAMFAKGQGTAPDPVIAHMWFALATRGPEIDVRRRADAARVAVAKSLLSVEVDQAQQLAREWRPKRR